MFEYNTNEDFETSRKYGFSSRIIKDEKSYKHIVNKLYEI